MKLTRDTITAVGFEIFAEDYTDRVSARHAWDDMGGSEPDQERAEIEATIEVVAYSSETGRDLFRGLVAQGLVGPGGGDGTQALFGHFARQPLLERISRLIGEDQAKQSADAFIAEIDAEVDERHRRHERMRVVAQAAISGVETGPDGTEIGVGDDLYAEAGRAILSLLDEIEENRKVAGELGRLTLRTRRLLEKHR